MEMTKQSDRKGRQKIETRELQAETEEKVTGVCFLIEAFRLHGPLNVGNHYK